MTLNTTLRLFVLTLLAALFSNTLRAEDRYTETIPGTLVKFEMIRIPAGQIKLPGADDPAQIKSIYVAATELTWNAYDVWAYGMDLEEEEKVLAIDAKARPSKPYGAPDRGFGHSGYPTLGISYKAAVEYCKWLSEKTGKKYRLPTEAEWTYFCRAGADHGPEDVDKVAWHEGNSDEKSHPVGKKEPNAWGLFDTLGNVAEWVDGADGRPVAAGGSWMHPAEKISCWARDHQTEDWQSSDPQIPKSEWWLTDGEFVGFRVVCDPD